KSWVVCSTEQRRAARRTFIGKQLKEEGLLRSIAKWEERRRTKAAKVTTCVVGGATFYHPAASDSKMFCVRTRQAAPLTNVREARMCCRGACAKRLSVSWAVGITAPTAL